MPDRELPSPFIQTDPATRLGRVIQQLESFGELHGTELENLADDLASVGAPDVAAHVRLYRDVQQSDAQQIVAELIQLQADMLAAAPDQPPTRAGTDPDAAAHSSGRARWQLDQATEGKRRKQPFSRRDFFGRGTPKPDAE
jgi:hypothetical protein